MNTPKPPKELDQISDVVLAYRPKPKSKPAKKRARRRNKILGWLGVHPGKAASPFPDWKSQ